MVYVIAFDNIESYNVLSYQVDLGDDPHQWL